MAYVPGQTMLVKTLPAQGTMLMPVNGSGVDVPAGTLLMKGTGAGSDTASLSTLIPVTASSNAHVVGVLGDLHKFSVVGDATTQTLKNWYPGFASQNVPSHDVDLIDTVHMVRVPYSLSSTGISVTSVSGSDLVYNIGTVEANLDGGFIYINAGSGVGQLGFIKASATNTSISIISALTTVGTSSSKLIKILPLFYDTPIWKVNSTTFGTMLDTTGAAGTGRAVVLGNFISVNGVESRLDPKAYHNSQGLNSVGALDIYAYVGLVDTAFHPIA